LGTWDLEVPSYVLNFCKSFIHGCLCQWQDVIQSYPKALTGYAQDAAYSLPTAPQAPPAQTGYYYGNYY